MSSASVPIRKPIWQNLYRWVFQHSRCISSKITFRTTLTWFQKSNIGKVRKFSTWINLIIKNHFLSTSFNLFSLPFHFLPEWVSPPATSLNGCSPQNPPHLLFFIPWCNCSYFSRLIWSTWTLFFSYQVFDTIAHRSRFPFRFYAFDFLLVLVLVVCVFVRVFVHIFIYVCAPFPCFCPCTCVFMLVLACLCLWACALELSVVCLFAFVFVLALVSLCLWACACACACVLELVLVLAE